jgi:3-deoxy-D-manno-octulosonic-acid transferase
MTASNSHLSAYNSRFSAFNLDNLAAKYVKCSEIAKRMIQELENNLQRHAAAERFVQLGAAKPHGMHLEL